MNKAQAQKLAIKKYGKTARVDKPKTDSGGFYSCPFYVYKGDNIVGWGHSWKQALAGPCPHYKGTWPSKPVVLSVVIVPQSPFNKTA